MIAGMIVYWVSSCKKTLTKLWVAHVDNCKTKSKPTLADNTEGMHQAIKKDNKGMEEEMQHGKEPQEGRTVDWYLGGNSNWEIKFC